MTTYSMTPINNGTRLRFEHNVFASVITSFNAKELLEGVELWEAPADGVEVKKGDKWLKVLKHKGAILTTAGWTAIIHKGVAVCNNFKEIIAPPPVDPPVNAFPDYFDLTDPSGETARYSFMRVLP